MTEKKLQDIAGKSLHKALSQGASAAEVFLNRTKELAIEVSDQRVETMKLAEQHGLGIRVLKNHQPGFAYTSDLSDSALDQTISQAIANAASTGEDKFSALPGPVPQYPDLNLYDSGIDTVPVEEKIDLAKEIENLARKHDPRVKITERCAYTDAVYEVAIYNSLGVQGNYRGSYCGAYAFLVAEEEGESQTGFGFQYQLKYQEIDPRFIAGEAAKKAVRMLGAKNIGTRAMPAVLDPYVAVDFLGLMAHALFAESVQKGKSRLAGKIGRQVSSDLVTLVDDGSLPGGIMSSPFDGEGVPSQRTILIDRGVLKGYLYNTYAAGKDGVKSTGNGIRGSYKGTPEIGTTNFYLEKGDLSREEILKQVETGIYLTDILGMHTANPISGDFSLGAAGLLIERGELTRPVRGIAVAGNVFDLFSAIDGVGSDLTFFVGKGSPTLRIAQMTVSGS